MTSSFFTYMRRRCLLPFAVLALAGCVLWGCGEDQPEKKDPRVVVLAPLSGSFAGTGQDIHDGMELAVFVVREAVDLPLPLAAGVGLVNHPGARLELAFADTDNDPEQAASLVADLGASGRITVFTGCYSSSVTAQASTAAEILGIPFLNAHSTAPSLTRRGYRWFFRTTPDDSVFTRDLLDFWGSLQKNRERNAQPDTLALVYERGVWGTGVAREGIVLALRHGLHLVADVPYDPGNPDISAALGEVRQAEPDVILQASYLPDAVSFMQGYKRENINPRAILAMDAGFSDPLFASSLGKDAEYVFSREVYSSDLAVNKPLVGQVADLFRQRYDREMTGTAVRAFVGMLVLADALNRAETFAPADVRAALTATRLDGARLPVPWDGVRFDPESGQNVLGRGIVVQMIGGRYRTVWPPELATSRLVWPVPHWEQR